MMTTRHKRLRGLSAGSWRPGYTPARTGVDERYCSAHLVHYRTRVFREGHWMHAGCPDCAGDQQWLRNARKALGEAAATMPRNDLIEHAERLAGYRLRSLHA